MSRCSRRACRSPRAPARPKPVDFSKVIVDTTVQPKAVAFPTDAKLMHRARERLVRLAKKTGVELRQSYERVGKHALIAHQRYAHAKQFKRANRALKTIRTYLDRVTRDIVRKIESDAELESVFAHPLMLGRRVREQRQHQRGRKNLPSGSVESSLHVPGRMHRQGQGASALRIRRQGVDRHHAASLGRRPVHRPRQGAARQSLRRPHTRDRDPGDRDADRREPCPRRRRPRLSRPQRPARPQVQGLYLRPETPRHRDHQTRVAPPNSAVEPVIGHAKAEHRMGRNYLAGTHGDAANAVLAAAGYNFRRLLDWLALLLSAILAALTAAADHKTPIARSVTAFFTDRRLLMISDSLREGGAQRQPSETTHVMVAAEKAPRRMDRHGQSALGLGARNSAPTPVSHCSVANAKGRPDSPLCALSVTPHATRMIA